jgi:hypothetical protein
MHKMFVLSIRWAASPIDPHSIDAALEPFADWIRLNGQTWLVWSDAPAGRIAETVRGCLQPEESVLVFGVDPSDADGWERTWVWSWIASKRETGDAMGSKRVRQGQG